MGIKAATKKNHQDSCCKNCNHSTYKWRTKRYSEMLPYVTCKAALCTYETYMKNKWLKNFYERLYWRHVDVNGRWPPSNMVPSTHELPTKQHLDWFIRLCKPTLVRNSHNTILYNAFEWARQTPKIAHSCADLDPIYSMVCWVHQSYPPKRHFHRFRHFCRAHERD